MSERIEQIISRALEKTDNDRYKLSVLVFSRVRELSMGAQQLTGLREDIVKRMDVSDIALREIADGKITMANRI